MGCYGAAVVAVFGCLQVNRRRPQNPTVIEKRTMIFKYAFFCLALFLMPIICMADDDETSFTAPQFLVDAKIVEDHRKSPSLMAVRLYFDQTAQSSHAQSRPSLGLEGNYVRQVSMLHSEWVRFPFGVSKFRTVDGKSLTFEEVRDSLSKPVAILLVPDGAAVHPAIKKLLDPHAIIVSRDREKNVELVKRPESR